MPRPTFLELFSRRRNQISKVSRSLKQATTFRLEALEDRTLLAANFGFAYAMGDNSSLSNRSQAWDIALDLDGNTVMTGAFQGTVNFNPGGSAFNLTSSSSSATDIFVAKYDQFGDLIWAKGFGASLYDEGYGIITDNDGNVYATGYFQGTVNFGGSSLTSEGVSDAFIIKLSGADGSTTWAQHFWGYDTALNNYGEDIGVDIWGNVYTCGIYDATYGVTDPENMFLLKLSSSGDYLWYGEFEGTGPSDASNVAIDEWGQVYFSGSFSNTMDFDIKSGDYNLTSRGKTDVFLAKYDTAGNFLWAESWGGTQADRGYALILDGMANAYVSGSFQGTAQMDPTNAGYTGPFALTSLGQDDIFLNKFTDQGVIEWTVHNGGTGDDEGLSLAVDSRSQIYLTGSFQNTAAFPVGSANSLTANNASGNLATFVQKITQAGTTVWVEQLGGFSVTGAVPGDVEAFGIVVDPLGKIYTAGILLGRNNFNPNQPPTEMLPAAPGGVTSEGFIFLSQLDEPRDADVDLPNIAVNTLIQPTGIQVATLLDGILADPNPNAKRGIAITDRLGDPSSGNWMYRLNGTTTWIQITGTGGGDVSPDSALLLRGEDFIQFVPRLRFIGYSSILFRAWDQTWGAAGYYMNLTMPGTTGGASAFSLRDAICQVQTVSRPVLDNGGTPNTFPNLLAPVTPYTYPVSQWLGASMIYGTTGLQGIALTGLTGTTQGTWQKSLDGGTTWTAIGTVSSTQALLLRSTDLIRFIPTGTGFSVTATYVAWDQSKGTVGTKVNVASTPGAFSIASDTATIQIKSPPAPRPPAPVLTGANNFTNVTRNSTNPPGNTVNQLLSGFVTPTTNTGICIVTQVGSQINGRWQYRLSGSTMWLDIGYIAPDVAFLLRGTDMIRFLPRAGFVGTASITFHAWNQTQGSTTGGANMTLLGVTGGNTPFSTGVFTSSCNVVPAPLTAPGPNVLAASRPTLVTDPKPTLPPIYPNMSNEGTTVAALITNRSTSTITDEVGIAITGFTSPGGSWQVSLDDGVTWLGLGTVSNTSGLLLRNSDRVRFIPNAGVLGKALLTYKAWDQSTGSAGFKVDTSTSTAFSSNSVQAVLIVNTAPIIL